MRVSPTARPATEIRPDCPGAIVLGGAHGSLAVVRSLGRRRIPVCVLTADHPIARLSRYATHRLTWSGPGDPGALEFLIRLATDHDMRNWLLFTGGDAEAEWVARNHAALSEVFRVTGPDWTSARWAIDKRLAYQRAADLGLAYPTTYALRGRDDAMTVACRFPVILKPAVKESVNAFTLAKAWRADDRAQLLARYDLAATLVDPATIVVQEMIPGDGTAQFSYAAAWHRGAPLASLVARRTRQYPIDFGYTSTYVETIDRPDVEQAAVRFLSGLDFSGMVEVEFKFDARDGSLKLLDVNPRTWTWAELAAAAGVDFPWLLWRAAIGDVEPMQRGQPGVAWTHLARDLAALLHAAHRSEASTASHARPRTTVHAAFAIDDPLPGLADLPITLWRMLSRRLPVALKTFGRHLAAPGSLQPPDAGTGHKPAL